MPSSTPGFQGKRLAQAREARGLSAVNLADLLGISTTSISQYERGVQSPRPEIMEAISAKLNLPVARFLLPVLPEKSGRIYYRSMASATKSARIRAERKFEWFKEISQYAEEYFTFPDVDIPRFEVPSDFRKITFERIETIASETRHYFQIPDGPVPHLVSILERHGVVVARGNLEAETLDAFSEFPDDWRPFIFLGADKNVAVRSRFDAAHELAHLVLHRDIDKKHLAIKKDFKILESQAHRFASAFLLPENEFLKDLWVPTLDAFRALKGRWKAAIAAMIKRCEDLEVINENQARRLWVNLGRRSWRKKEPLDDSIPVETSSFLRQCIELLVMENVRTKSQIVDDLMLSQGDIEELTSLPKGFLTERSTPAEVKPIPKFETTSAEPKNEEAGKVIHIDRRR
ncbi:MAG: XRE family transcriptional regulator [Nitrospinae bacterium]|nr:XRE family transcriptional regulator [Nitrospinota bacterium]